MISLHEFKNQALIQLGKKKKISDSVIKILYDCFTNRETMDGIQFINFNFTHTRKWFDITTGQMADNVYSVLGTRTDELCFYCSIDLSDEALRLSL